MEIPEKALGAIIAATITSLVSLLGLILAKEHKTSEFRQSWIDALREEIADFISHFISIRASLSISGKLSDDLWHKSKDDFVALNRASSRIRLRLNPKETSSKNISRIIKKFEDSITESSLPSEEETQSLTDELLTESQTFLKKEWNRVRNGEVVFQIARATSFTFLLVGIAFLVYSELNS